MKPYGRVFGVVRRLVALLAPGPGAVATLALLVALVSAVPLAVPWLIGVAFDEAIVPRGDRGLLLTLAVAMLLAELASLLFSFLKDFFTAAFSERLVFGLRDRIFGHLQRLPIEYHDRQRVGALAARTLDEPRSLEDLFQQGIAAILIAPIAFAGMLGIMIWMSPRLTLVALAPAPFLYLAILLFVKSMRRLAGPVKDAGEDLSAGVHENLSSIRTVQLLGREEAEAERLRRKGRRLLGIRLEVARLVARYYPLMGFLTGAGTIIALAYGGGLAIGREITLGKLVAFLAYLAFFYAPLLALTRANHILQNVAAAGERVLEVLDVPPGPAEKPDARPLPDGPLGVSFARVSFAHGDRPVLRGATLDVAPGERVGIVGKTGSGKSTLAALVPRLYDAAGVSVGGVDVRDLRLADLRRAVALVGQGDFLFDGTVRENLSGSSDPEMLEALAAAALELPLEQALGERGRRLSEGERQRLCLARTILRRPRVLILDEATSALDEETERAILERILSGGVTAIVITHRERPLEWCDRVVRLEEGVLTPAASSPRVPS